MKWAEIKISTSSEASEAVCEMLDVIGAHGVSVEDPSEIAAIINAPGSLSYADEGYLESLGDTAVVKAYFPDTGQPEFSSGELVRLVRSCMTDIGKFLDTGICEVAVKMICDEDWANNWKKYFKPLRISPRVLICPSWEDCAGNDEAQLIVRLDPGSAFGTGDHATTAMCAVLLDNEIASRNIKPTVLDLGCGSGILSIIAAGLGAKKVDAIDIDPVAADVAYTNCRENGVCGIVDVMTGELSHLAGRKYDIIAANIIADVIASLAKEIPGKLSDGGVFIASGIISSKKDFVLNACIDAGLSLVNENETDGWSAMSFKVMV